MLINLNADLGEAFGPWTMGDDDALLAVAGAANIACGFHAGDPLVMRRTVRAALARGVSAGAHPSYPDLQGFGRRAMALAPEELEAVILYQLGALAGMIASEGGRMSHVKPHGALSNQACADPLLAATVARAVAAFDRHLILLAPACSALVTAGRQAGLTVAQEIFADRAYAPDGQLLPRCQAGAVVHNPAQGVARALAMLERGGILTPEGRVLPTPIHSICIHGDHPGAGDAAQTLARALVHAGHTLAPLTDLDLD